MQVLVGEEFAATMCTAGFAVEFPDPNDQAHRLTGFLIAAQCAEGDRNASVAVMKIEDDGMAPTRTEVGKIAYLTEGQLSPHVAGEPWTVPTSPLAVFSTAQGAGTLPIDVAVNGRHPTAATVPNAAAVQTGRTRATWSGLGGTVATGRVLEVAATPELRDIPAGIERVVVAADDTNTPLTAWIIGAPVTVEPRGSTENLGIITGIDDQRHWIVVDLIAPFLARHNADLFMGR
ncbi:hypothetical protein [Mycolicibacter minnesotensis]